MAKAARRKPTICDGLKRGGHVGCIYATEEERAKTLVAFLRCGLEAREKVLYVATARAAEPVRSALRGDSCDPEPYQASGAFAIVAPDTAASQDGVFNAEALIAYLAAAAEKARAEGYAGLRIVYEIEWASSPDEKTGHLIRAFETKMSALCAGTGSIVMCVYGRSLAPAQVLLDVLLTHPFIVVDGELHKNLFAMPSEALERPDRAAATFEYWVEHLRAHRRMEHEIEANEKKYRLVIDNASDVLYSFSLQGTVEFISPNVRHWGYEPDEIIGTPFIKYIYPADLKLVLGEVKKAIDTEEPVLVNLRLVKKNGEVFAVEEVGAVTKDERGRVIGITGIIRDTSLRRKAEEAAKRSEEKYRSLFDGAADLIAVIDTHGVFLDLNKKFEEESQWSREEMLGKNVFKCGIVTPGSIPKMAYTMAQILAGREYSMIEVDGVRKDSGKVPYELRAIPIKENGKIVAVQAILRNLSERRKSEENLRRRMDELEKFNKFAVGREMKMMELKERIRELEEKLDKK